MRLSQNGFLKPILENPIYPIPKGWLIFKCFPLGIKGKST